MMAIPDIELTDVEITPEMIEAGVDALCSCNDAFSSEPDAEYTARSVFEAMCRVRGLVHA